MQPMTNSLHQIAMNYDYVSPLSLKINLTLMTWDMHTGIFKEDSSKTMTFPFNVINLATCHTLLQDFYQYNNFNISKEEKEKYQSPLPTTFVPTKQDCSNNALEVQALE